MTTFNEYQYDDLQARSDDLYARTKYEIIMGFLEGRAGLGILNAGCGSGDLSFMLAEAGHRVLGIDPAPEYIALAQRAAAGRGASGCSFRVSSIEDFEAPAPFDCVIATDVLEHIQDDRAAFRKVVSLVKRGGSVILTVPAGPWLFGYHDEALGHFRRYSRASLEQVVGDLCRIGTIRYFGFTLLPISYMFSKVLRRPYPVAESGDSSRSPLVAAALRTLMRLDKMVAMPLGTSLIMEGVRP